MVYVQIPVGRLPHCMTLGEFMYLFGLSGDKSQPTEEEDESAGVQMLVQRWWLRGRALAIPPELGGG